jgi:hypothetical protein
LDAAVEITRLARLSLRTAIAGSALALFCAPAMAEGPYRSYRAHAAPEPLVTTEGRGCYWYRQRQYCGRYCYTEINGQRYCREREREAFPQAAIDAVEYAAPLPPQYGSRMKLGR